MSFLKKISIVSAVAVVSALVPAAISSAQDDPTALCSGDVAVVPIEARLVIHQPTPVPSFTVSASIPAGEYSVMTHSSDGYPNRPNVEEQEYEQYVLEFLDDTGAIIDVTGMTADLEDFVEEANWVGSVGTIVLDRPAVQVRAHHAWDGVNAVLWDWPYQSVRPVCFGVSQLTPTTTTTTTTSSTTTVPDTTTTTPTDSTTTTTPTDSTTTTTPTDSTTTTTPTDSTTTTTPDDTTTTTSTPDDSSTTTTTVPPAGPPPVSPPAPPTPGDPTFAG